MDHLNAERAKYEKMWAQPAYRERSPGFRLVATAFDWMGMREGQTLCDYGAGTGRASQWLADHGLRGTAFDIAENAITEFDGPKVIGTLWDMPAFGTFDYGFCCDVMEHIPPEHVSDCLKGIALRTARCAFFQIALFECHMGKGIGEHLHLTVKPTNWWVAALQRHFGSVEIKPGETKYVIAKCTP